MDEARRDQVLNAESPYRELFGTDVGVRGRKRFAEEVMAPLPDAAIMPDRKAAHRLSMKIHFRALQVLKHLYAADFRGIFEKEMALELERLSADGPDPAPVLRKRRRQARNGK